MAHRRVAKDFDLGFGHLGNGTICWNSNLEINNDYESVAHISEEGTTITWYVADLPVEVADQIRELARAEIKPPLVVDESKLPEGFDVANRRYDGYGYVKCDPHFNSGKHLWLRKEKVDMPVEPKLIEEVQCARRVS